MKKDIDTSAIANELKGRSRYFEQQSERLSQQSAKRERVNARTDERVNERTRERTNARTDEQVNMRTSERTNVRTSERSENGGNAPPPAKRVIMRASFQLYSDQMQALRRYRAELELQGERRDLSQMVREAIAKYLVGVADPTNTRTVERVNERTAERTNERTSERRKRPA